MPPKKSAKQKKEEKLENTPVYFPKPTKKMVNQVNQ